MLNTTATVIREHEVSVDELPPIPGPQKLTVLLAAAAVAGLIGLIMIFSGSSENPGGQGTSMLPLQPRLCLSSAPQVQIM